MNGIFKMTDPSSSPLSNLATTTTMVSPSATALAGDDLENETIEVPPPMDIQAQPKLLPDNNPEKLTTDESNALVRYFVILFKVSFFFSLFLSCVDIRIFFASVW